jgi:hypothetical protein
MTIWLDGAVGGSGQFKASCFDCIEVAGCFSADAPPTILQHPSPANPCPAQTAQFSVTASGDSLQYQWQKDQSDLADGGDVSGATTATLTIANADSTDEADYRCVVTNANGTAYSNPASLVLKAPTSITAHPSNKSVDAGQATTFSVTATGEGQLQYQWQKNSSDLSDGGHYSGCTTSTLTISSADESDEGDYRCVVTADCGSVNSNQASLTVNTPSGIPCDFDADGDVDLEDFSHFQVCLSGFGVVQDDPTCQDALLDGDTDVDQADMSVFLQCLIGAEIPGDPNCAD